MGTGVAYIQLAVGADPCRHAGRAGLGGGWRHGGVDLAVYGETACLAVPLHDAVEGAGRRQLGHTAVDDDDAGTRRAADDRLRRSTPGLIDHGGRGTETAKRTARPRHDAGVRLAHNAKPVAAVMFAT